MDKKRIGVISLGCDKNRVDTEKMLSIICSEHTLVNDLSTAQIVIINTCAFLESARKEAIEEILAVNEFRENGCLEKIIVTGCLPQKFANDFFDDFIEIDALLGVSDYSKLLTVINRIYAGERVMEIGEPKNECIKGRVLTTKGYAYLKIADGCSNHCTYCLIPKIRGKFRSVKKSELIEEAKSLGQVNELILVAQDLTRYGEDLGDTSLCDLIRALSSLPNILGIRLMYCYPEGISDELIRELSSNAKLIRYIDIPLQHASDRILKLMNRKGSFNSYLSLIERLKRDVYGIAIRSTFITGFPTETEEDFNILVDFIKRAKLFNAGFFAYSREEDTPAYQLSGQIKKGEKTRRLKKLYSVQKSVVKENLKSLIGKTFSVTVEGFDEDMLVYYGRAYFNAPDIDGKIYFFSSEPTIYNQNVNVKIIKAQGYDLYGEKQ